MVLLLKMDGVDDIGIVVYGIIPVELTSFTASVDRNNVKLLWETASELNNSGISIERKIGSSEFMEVGFVPGFGTTSEPKSYSFTDQNPLRTIYLQVKAN